MRKLQAVGWLLCTGMLAACASVDNDSTDVGLASQALAGPCDEMVPATRNVDGIPAYAQCTASQDSAIYSNNGVDTSLTQQGSDWVKTQYSGGYQCTELAHRYLYFRWKVKWIPNGNAGNWCDTQPPASSGVVQTMTPVHGDIMVLAGGSCGAAQSTGHVNVIDTVDAASASVVAVEQNVAGRHKYMQSCAKCFLHVVANDGTPSPAATTAGSAAPATAGAPAPAGSAAPPTRPSGRAGAAAPTTPPTTTPVATNGGATATPPTTTTQPTAAGAAAPATTGTAPNSLSAAGSPGPETATAAPSAPRPRAPAPESACSVASTRWNSHPGLALLWLAVLGGAIAVRRRR